MGNLKRQLLATSSKTELAEKLELAYSSMVKLEAKVSEQAEELQDYRELALSISSNAYRMLGGNLSKMNKEECLNKLSMLVGDPSLHIKEVQK